MNDNVPTTYPRWSCMGCGSLNNAGENKCWSCYMGAGESETLYQQAMERRQDPRPLKLAIEQREAHRTFDALPRASEYHEPYNPSHAELLGVVRKAWWRRKLWAVFSAFWQGVFSALVFIGWCILVAFFVMGVVSLFIH